MKGVVLAAALLATLPAAAGAQAPADRARQGGFGGLTQDDLTIRLRTTSVEIRFTPLDDRILALLAPDVQRSLRGLLDRKRPQIDSAAAANGISRPGLALVGFFGLRAAAPFDAELLNVQVRNRLFRPLAIVPYSGPIGAEQLDVRQGAQAIYLFEEELPVFEPLGVQYGGSVSNDWERRLATLDRERQRVAGRARAAEATSR